MTTNSGTNATKLPTALRYVLPLLAFSVFINYIDRGNLSIAAPMLKDELGMSASQLGILLSSFFWTYSLFLILSGWLVDRVSVSWVMAIGFFLWSAATSVTGFLHGFTALLVVRLVLGIGESVAYPSYSKILAKYFPAAQRASANSIIASGLACGPAFGMLLGGVLMSRFGWRSFFVVLGSISLVWLLPWFRWMPRGPGIATEMQPGPEPTTLEILKQRSAWGTFLGLFCTAYSLYFLTAWLPFYLVRERHFSMDTMAKIGGAVFLTQALSSFVSGWIGDRWIAAGGTRTRVHMTFMIAGLLGTGGCLLATSLVGPALSRGAVVAGRRFGRVDHGEYLADKPDPGGPSRLGTMDWTAVRLWQHFRRSCLCCNWFHTGPDRRLFLGLRGCCCALYRRRADVVVPGMPCGASPVDATDFG